MSRARGQWLLVVTPISAVLVVLLGVLSGGARPFRSARVYSGPTQGITDLRLRVELGARDRVVELPVADTSFTVVVVEGGQTVASARARTDSAGSAEVALRLPRPRDSALELRVEPVGHDLPPLARGLVLGSVGVFRSSATERGGFQSGRSSGQLELAIAPARGALVTAQGALDDELVLRATHQGAAAAGVRMTVKLEGAEPAESQSLTDAQGLARLRVRPNDPFLRVSVQAHADGLGDGTLSARLDVVQGAIRATRKGDTLLLESSGAATSVHLGFFDHAQRYAGARVQLRPAPDGHLLGELHWPAELTASPLWVVASSQADLASPSAVGWPVVGQDTADPKTFDARELLLLDGAPAARQREERRAKRVRIVSAAYASVALLITLYLFVRRVKESDARFEQHLTSSGVDGIPSIAPPRKGRAILAAACIGLGFVVLAVFALLKD